MSTRIKEKGKKNYSLYSYASRQGQAWVGTAMWVEAGTGLRGWAWAQCKGTQTWAGCKHEHKNKVKKKNHSPDSLCKQVGRGGHIRCGQAWSGVSQ